MSLKFLNRLGAAAWLAAMVGMMFRATALGAEVKPPPKPAFELRDGDRVAFIGDTFVEREQRHGFIESRLTARYHDRKFIWRNLGWSGDTPSGISRVSFDWSKPESEWFKRLIAHVDVVKPTVVILGYGMANSFDGEAGLPAFKQGMERLIDAIRALDAEHPARFLILGPIPHEPLPPPFPDAAPHNAVLSKYDQALKGIASARSFPFVSLFEQLQKKRPGKTKKDLTDNGIHLNAYGYRRAAEEMEQALGMRFLGWRFSVLEGGRIRDGSDGIDVKVMGWSADGFSMTAKELQLMVPFFPGEDGTWAGITPACNIQLRALRPGVWALKVAGEEVERASSVDWSGGRPFLRRGPLLDQAEELRQAILKKNELYFHRWRPQNETYLFGFRKHEQGVNAREIPMFDPLITEMEAKIDTLKKPVERKWEVVFLGETEADAAKIARSKAPPRENPTAQTLTSSPGVVTPQPLPEFEVAPGFEVNLFAENPLLAKPIQMNFDPQGRLWIASSSIYPQIQPGEKADDKIIVLEDSNHDGVADKSTAFADGLLIPTGVEPGNGGVYVGQSTELLFLKDHDGDGKADERRVVLSGFGTEDTHHILHTLRWGTDGRLYMNQSIYIHSHIETPHGVRRLNSGGTWRFDPKSHDLEVFLRGFCNPWGHDFDAYGQSFVTDGAGFQGVSWGVPGAMYFTYAGGRRILESISPGTYPKFCGLELVASRQFPDEWQGNAITCDFRAHRVVRFSIHETGSGYTTQQMPDFLRTTNVTFRPIDVKFGPDGALYVADWSNPIIQHGEVDFRDPRRDRSHGRIWRISAKGKPSPPAPNLQAMETEALLNHLTASDGYGRRQARRVLVERGASITNALEAWTLKQNADEAQLEGLWLYQALDWVNPALIEKLAGSKDARIRAAATRVLAHWQPRMATAGASLEKQALDESGRVRVEAARGLSRAPSLKTAETVLGMLDRPMDPFLDYALWLSINDAAAPWVNAVREGAWKTEGREKQFEFALRAIDPKLAGDVVGKFLEARPIPANGDGATLSLVAQAGGPAELSKVFAMTSGDHLNSVGKTKALSALASAARDRQARPDPNAAELGALISHADGAVRAAAIGLAGAWKAAPLVPKISFAVSKAGASTDEKLAGVSALREIGGAAGVEALKLLSKSPHETGVRTAAVQALAALDLQQAAPLVLETLASLPSDEETLGLWRGVLAVRNASPVLLKHLPRSGISTRMAKTGTRAARENGRHEPELVLALARGANLDEESQALSEGEIKALAARVTAQGDAMRGEHVYRRADLGCVACHAIGGAGGKVGPDLTSIGASAPIDYLIESTLYPNRKVKEGYHSILIETRDDEEISGILLRETTDQVLIRDIQNREITVAKTRVRGLRSGASLMPSGLVDALSMAERLDLFRFLSELGKPGRFDASKASVARHWKLKPAVHTTEQFGEDPLLQSSRNPSEWTPLYTLVDGTVTAGSLRDSYKNEKYRGVTGIYAMTRFQTAGTGKVKLQFHGTIPLAAWVDGKAVSTGSEIAPDLAAGAHHLLIKLDARTLPERFSLGSSDAAFLAE